VKKGENRIEVTGSVDPWDGSHKNVETISGYFAGIIPGDYTMSISIPQIWG
jgi:hypothetical protein